MSSSLIYSIPFRANAALSSPPPAYGPFSMFEVGIYKTLYNQTNYTVSSYLIIINNYNH